MRMIVCFLLALILSACALVPAPPIATMKPIAWKLRQQQLSAIDAFKISGALGVVSKTHRGFSASYSWQQRGNRYNIELSGPLGAGAVLLHGQPGQITLKDSKGEFHAATPEALLVQQLGWRLPISNLKYWIRGLPAPDETGQMQFDQFNHLQSLVQDGWHITFASYTQANGIDLPSRITLDNDKVRVKIVIHRWQLN